MTPVSIVIPCYNPLPFVFEAVASCRAQTCGAVEIILVNDGTADAAGRTRLHEASRLVNQYIEQPNRGLAAARNAGFRAATSDFVVPLDSDDTLDPAYVQTCLDAVRQRPEAAFVYTDYQVFGVRNYIERTPDYNLYRLLDRNSLTYAALIRRADWESSGGYDETMKYGYEDWEFWLRLGARGRFGHRVPRVLFRYRKHGPSLFDVAASRHDELVAHIRAKHGDLYSLRGRTRVKAAWEPSVCILADPCDQTLADCAFVQRPDTAPGGAVAFLSPGGGQQLDPHSGEYAALAVWGGKGPLCLPDGSVARSKEQLRSAPLPQPTLARHYPSGRFAKLRRKLIDANLLSWEAWRRRPWESALRLIPLRWKERANRAAGREIFNLDFYLRFQPGSAVLAGVVTEPLVYFPRFDSRRRIAFLTPHLGPGGAEGVLLDMASALGRPEFEMLLLAAHSSDDRWLNRWKLAVDHIYDIAALVSAGKAAGAIAAILVNWQPDTILIQNSLLGYALLPYLRRHLPGARMMDLIHSVDEDWNLIAATKPVAPCLDARIAVAEAIRQRLLESGIRTERVRLAQNGVDLARFAPAPCISTSSPYRILFAARLDPVKRPLLLPSIARELRRNCPREEFRFIVAGDGPEATALSRRIARDGLDAMFDLRGHVPDVAPLLAECDLLILPSRSEGLPLVILEAFAASRPVVASAVGAVSELVNERTGILIPVQRGEVRDFAHAIACLALDPDRRRRMGEEARRHVEQEYSREIALGRYRALF